MNYFRPESLQTHLLILFGCIAASKITSVIFLRALQFYLDRVGLGLKTEVRVKNLYSPWLSILILACTLPKLIRMILQPADQEFFLGLLKIIVLYCGVMMITQSLTLMKVIFKKYFDYKDGNNIKKRAITTQVQFIEKIFIITLWSAAFIATLCSFQEGKDFAKSLVASAGILGVVIGFAAQKSLSNLMAGFQLAFTQPIRLDDVVVVEGQWGKVEKITLTYVVICLWDLRRLVVPIYYFIEKPFENWTKTSSNLLPFILIHVDYSLPVEALRKEFKRVVQETELWDGKVAVMQVTDMNEKTMVIRALMSAGSASEAFDLRCLVREKLIGFIQKNYSDSLPKSRLNDFSKIQQADLLQNFGASLGE